ncbi:putative inactive peptidyl-prolyl cis-trans isomerase-like 6 [Borealophlyctis nickersoniae]|nr:putative inactive peptidyl-prolyl cis-trans isomerase-like 6 [Borealophlyctis nickersoniae]
MPTIQTASTSAANHSTRKKQRLEQTFSVTGCVGDPAFQQAKMMAESLANKYPGRISCNITPLLPLEFFEFRQHLKKDHPTLVDNLYPTCTITQNGTTLLTTAQFLDVAREQYVVEDTRPVPLYQALARTSMSEVIKSRKHPFVYMDIRNRDTGPVGRLLIELYDDVCPKTVGQFLKFVRGEDIDGTRCEYRNSLFTRLLPNGWIQAGEFTKPDGSILREPPLEDENFIVPHAHRGTISMVNAGPHSNFSAFMITFGAKPYFDRKYVAFGRVMDGEETLAMLESTPTVFERPVVPVFIEDVGVYVVE